MSFIVETLGQYASVAFWGAGAKAQAIMTALGDESRVDFVFDSDINKQGKFIINCSTPILLPSTETLHSVDLVMIFAVSYQDEIMNSLKEDVTDSKDETQDRIRDVQRAEAARRGYGTSKKMAPPSSSRFMDRKE